MFKNKRGITLIALVVTIIVILILVGISILMLTGDNGILQKATTAKTETEKAQIIENAQTDILAQQTDNKSSYITKEQLAKILNKYFEHIESSDLPDEVLSTDQTKLIILDTEYTVNLSEVFKGKFSTNQNNWNSVSQIFEPDGTTAGKMHVGDYVKYPVGYTDTSDYRWRVLSVSGEGKNQRLKLISVGAFLGYRYKNNRDEGIRELTVNIFDARIASMSNSQSYGFIFNDDISSMSDIMEQFNNKYTDKYKAGEIATIVDYFPNQSYSNENVEGRPKVRSIITQDIIDVNGSVNNINGVYNNLFGSYVWVAASGGTSMGGDYLAWLSPDYRSNDGDRNCVKGVQLVVELSPDVQYALTEKSEEQNVNQVWDLR